MVLILGWNTYPRSCKVPIMILALFLMVFAILLAAFRTNDWVLIIASFVFLIGVISFWYGAKFFTEE